MSADNASLIHAGATVPRICMISTHGYVAAHPPLGAADTGGQVVFILELSKKLAQLGYEVDIWTRRFADQPEVDIVDEQVRVIRVPCGGSDFIPKEYLYKKIPEWSENALRFIEKHGLKYEFINSHYWDAGLAGERLAKALKIPHLHTPHSLGVWKQTQMEADFPEDQEKFEEDFNFTERNKHERNIYHSCNLVIATTPMQVDMLQNDYGLSLNKVQMIPPGYDDNRFFQMSGASRDAARQKFGFEGPTVLSLGRLATNKGYDLLIQGFAVVAERMPEAKLHLAIGGEKMDDHEQGILNELKDLVEQLNLKSKVKFSGFVPSEDLADIYRAADLFVLSSRYEPFGMTAIEAMACGTPTVATTHGGLFRVLSYGTHGLYADTLDKEDLGITMLKPLRYPRVWNRLSREGAQLARSLFTWTGIAQQMVSAVEHRSVSRFAVGDETGAGHGWTVHH